MTQIVRAITRKAFEWTECVFGAKTAARLAVKYAGYCWAVDPDEVTAAHLLQYPKANLTGPRDFVPSLFNVYYGNKSANDVVPDVSITRAESFVPYYQGRTNLILYNFFGRNYGIRDPILFRFIVLDGSTPVWIVNRVLAADQVICLDDFSWEGTPKELPQSGSIVVQAFHPRIKAELKQLRYFAIYRDALRGTVCGVHSLELSSRMINAPIKSGFRSFGPPAETIVFNTCPDFHVPMVAESSQEKSILARLELSTPAKGYGAYFTIVDTEGSPTAIWHDGPNPHFATLSLSPKLVGPCKTAFSIPDFSLHAPVILIASHQVGFQPRSVQVSAYDKRGSCVAFESVAIHSDNFQLDLRDLFANYHFEGPVSVVVDFQRDLGEFEKPPECMVHVYYRSGEKFADQLSSLSTVGYRNDHFPKPQPYRCRKFAPLIKENGLKCCYDIINVGGTGPNPDGTIKIRILSDTSAEIIKFVSVSNNGITHISQEQLLSDDDDVERVAVVQIEHETTNFNATWFVLDQTTGHLGGDHFTGG